MIERVEQLEEEIKVLRYAYEQNILFLQSEKEVKDTWNATMPLVVAFVKEAKERIENLEESNVRLSKITAILSDSSEKASKLISDIIKIIKV